MIVSSCETRVGEKLISFLSKQNTVDIISFHPPSSKSYQSDLIRIPKINQDGSRSRDRYHIDVIFISQNRLWLVELKCKLSESNADIKKLRELISAYTFDELRGFIQSRITIFPKNDLNKVDKIVLALGVEVVDEEIEKDFVVIKVTEDINLLNCLQEDIFFDT